MLDCMIHTAGGQHTKRCTWVLMSHTAWSSQLIDGEYVLCSTGMSSTCREDPSGGVSAALMAVTSVLLHDWVISKHSCYRRPRHGDAGARRTQEDRCERRYGRRAAAAREAAGRRRGACQWCVFLCATTHGAWGLRQMLHRIWWWGVPWDYNCIPI